MLKALRWLLLSVMLVAGCGDVPSITIPTRSATSAAPQATPGQPAAPAQGAVAPSPSPPPSPSPSPSPTAVPPTRVKIGTSASLGGWIVDVAEKQGFLAGQRIVVERKETEPGSTMAAEDVEKRERDIGVVATDRLIQVGKNGQNLVMVAGLVNKAPFALIAAQDVADLAGLKGRPIGYFDEKSAAAAVLKRLLKARAISENDSRPIAFPDLGVVGAAVANGTVGASFVDPVRAGRLRSAGFKVLAEASDAVKDFQAEGLAVRPDWARQNEDTLTRLIRATIQAQRWIGDRSNKSAAIKLLADSLGTNEAEATIVYEQYVQMLDAIPREGDIDQAGVRSVVELLGEINAAGDPKPDPARLTDTSALQRAKQSLPR
ncbi:MAG: ABC transporter substrate-binding protein [Chloroflexi bacterium]|nr:ABC transporter substrate-binding protein [Chloroflexota bacterium]